MRQRARCKQSADNNQRAAGQCESSEYRNVYLFLIVHFVPFRFVV